MRILITGGAGFIGSWLAETHLAAGHEVAIVDNLSTGKRENIPPAAKFLFADITETNALERVFAEVKPDVVSHHAAQMDIRRSVREPVFDARVNILGSLAVLDASVRHGVKKVIFASSGGAVYGDSEILPASESAETKPISHYGAAKLSVERYLHVYSQLYGLRFMALRYANVYGPRQNPAGEAGVVAIFARQMLSGEVPTIFGDGSKTRDYVCVEDIARANMVALETDECGIFNIGTGAEVSDYQIFDAIRRYVGFAPEPRFAPRRLGEVERIVLDPSNALRVLGFEAKVALSSGIAHTVEYIRSQLNFRARQEREQASPLLSGAALGGFLS